MELSSQVPDTFFAQFELEDPKKLELSDLGIHNDAVVSSRYITFELMSPKRVVFGFGRSVYCLTAAGVRGRRYLSQPAI